MPIFNIRDNNVERAITVASKKAMQGNMVNVRRDALTAARCCEATR
jgi:hypothetical protein